MISLEQVHKRRAEILAVAARRKLSNVRVIGSVARGDQRSESDLDLLVACDPGCSLLDLVAFEQETTELLGVRVEAATEEGQKPRLARTILQDAVAL